MVIEFSIAEITKHNFMIEKEEC